MHSVWAVARNTISQTMRIKAAVAFIVLLVVLLPLMSLYMVGDGTLLGRLQTFVSYGLSLSAMLLSLFTIIAATYTVTSEIDQHQIYSLVTKPVTRFQVLAGKLLGILLVDAVLLVLFAGSIYMMAINVPRFADSLSMQDMARAQTQFFTARTSVKPVIDEAALQKEADDAYERLLRIDPTIREMPPQRAKAELRKHKELEKRALAPGGRLVWRFENVRPLDPEDVVFIRFKYETSFMPGEHSTATRWYFGRSATDQTGAQGVQIVYGVERNDAPRAVHEIPIPATAIGADGVLFVEVLSSPLNALTAVFPLEDGLQVLYRSGSFHGNYLRSTILLYARLAFLALLSISLATWLSFPVAALSGLVVLFMASMSGFIQESMSDTPGLTGYLYLPVQLLILLLPQFDKFNPGSYIVAAKMLSWTTVLWVSAVMVFIKGLVLWLFGVYVFNRREVAKVVV